MPQGKNNGESLLFASQPIFDHKDRIHGIELLYRNESGQGALDIGEGLATAEVVYHLSTAITRKANTFRVPAFVNVSEDILLSRHFLPVPPKQVIIELVERISPTHAVIEAVRRLKNQGYRFALDDFAFSEEWSDLLPLASYIKVDISTLPPAAVKLHRRKLSHLPLKWIAERVETREEHDAYRKLGFTLFQGYFYARPIPVYGKKIPASTLRATVLLNALHQPDPDMGEVISLIQSDPNLALKLTRVANSVFYGQHVPISSLRDIVNRLGLRQLTNWVALFGLLGGARSEHVGLALTRAKACELLAQHDQMNGHDAYFIGLLSTTDLLLGVSIHEFLARLKLNHSTNDAILHRKGAYGSILQRIEGTERNYAMGQSGSSSEDVSLLTLYHRAQHAAFEVLSLLTPLMTRHA